MQPVTLVLSLHGKDIYAGYVFYNKDDPLDECVIIKNSGSTEIFFFKTLGGM